MKAVCFITATRAEYGLLKWLMLGVKQSGCFQLQIIATGAHLLEEQGHTIDAVVQDGFQLDEVVDVMLDPSSTELIAAAMGRMAEQFSHAFARLRPDYVVVLGDRYELLPIVNTAFVMCIPIIHISGGDVTQGAIDDGIRNAVTMLASYHFPGTRESAKNIKRMRGSGKNVWAVGELGLDAFSHGPFMGRVELAGALGLDCRSQWVLFTYHPETREGLEYNLGVVRTCLSLLEGAAGVQVVATYANADYGGRCINRCLEAQALRSPGKFKVVPSLGNQRYLSFMKQAAIVVGNSSSGIVEAPALGIPVVNIGGRQKGRHLSRNIIQADATEGSIQAAISKAMRAGRTAGDGYWGDGHAAEKILDIMERELI